MRLGTFVIICANLGLSAVIAGCSTRDVVSQGSSHQVGASPGPRVEAEPSPTPDSPIRSIDFANFTYPAKPIYSKNDKMFTLQNGRYEGRYRGVFDIPFPVSLAYLAYGDVTSDEAEDAIVVLSENVKGSAMPYYVYVYTLEKGAPKLLWSFQTGDRGDGGIRQVYAENGQLVIELYGRNTLIGKDLSGMEDGVCCPKAFTRARYEWRGNKFRLKGAAETFPNPEGHGSPVMQPYRLSN